MSVLSLCLWLILLMLGTPLFAGLGISSAIHVVLRDFEPLVIPQKIATAADSFPLLAAPFFILMGNVMNESGVTQRIFRFANVLVGWMRGGLGHANIVASVIFAGMSGSAVADAGGLGTIEIKAMQNAGYEDEFSVAITAASSTIGPIIPPSLPMIIYAVLAGTSVGGLFIGGIIPGFLMAAALMAFVWLRARSRNYPREAFPTAREALRAFLEAFWALLAPVILLGGIISGIFTPTESAAVAAFYALILGLFVYRDLKWRDIPRTILATVETNGVVLALVMTAVLFGWNLSVAQVPQTFGRWIVGIAQEPMLVLLIVNLFLLFVGLFMEAIAAMMILVPILVPLADQLGISPIQFGIIFVLNLMIGTVTPPVGVVLFVTANVSGVSFERVTKAIIPFLVPLFLVLAAITLFPPLTTWLPKVLMGIG